MKSKVTFIPVLALLLSACTTGSYVTDRYDDIYYTPGEAIPTAIKQNAPSSSSSASRSSGNPTTINNSYSQGTQANSKNYIFRSTAPNADVAVYNMDDATLNQSDTTRLNNDSTSSTVINNYYTTNDFGYADRINFFYRGLYDPFFWNPWDDGYYSWGAYYNPYWSWNIGFGYDPYMSFYGGYYPYYNNWYSWGGGYGYGGFGYGGDYGYYNHPEGYHYGPRRSMGTAINRGGLTTGTASRSAVHRTGNIERSSSIPVRRTGQTILEERRNSISGTSGRTVTRTSLSTQQSENISRSGRRYVPSYTKPRTITRSVYNQNSTGSASYGKPSSVRRTGENNYRETYRSTYQRGSSSRVIRNSYRQDEPTLPATRTTGRSEIYRSPVQTSSPIQRTGGSTRSGGGRRR